MLLQVKVESEDLTPVRQNSTDAGLDLRAKQDYILTAHKRTLVGTGVRVAVPPWHVGLLFPRSSLSKYGITMTNSVGVIDSEYRGEVMASLIFNGLENSYAETVIKKGDRIVQLVVVPIMLCEVYKNVQSEEDWNNTTRGTGGFGSTGKN